jgi:SRSO17 transposase
LKNTTLEVNIMETAELVPIRKSLNGFLAQFDDCIKTQPSREHMRTYLGGQIGELPRKSIEPIALEAGVAPRTLQEFVGFHKWDQEAVRQRVQKVVAKEHGDPEAIAVIDETSFAKKGDDTTGVQRQYCGATGKTDNCVVTVHLGYATKDFHALIDGDLYLPETTWAENEERRRKAGIPDHVVFREKWRIALDLLDRTMANGVSFKYLTADEEYGRSGGFRRGVAAHGIQYVVEVPCSMSGWTHRPPMLGPEDYSGTGRHRVRLSLAPDAPSARRVDALWDRGGPSWQKYYIKDTGNGPVVWEVRATRFFPWENGSAGEEGWLLIARNVLDGEVKYFFSNAPADASVADLLRIAFSRWAIERLFEDGKGAVGLDHFEVRRYLALKRHLILSMVSLLFLVKETDRLRGKKSMVECFAGERGAECAA